MEILITALALLTIVVLIVLIGTGGRPMKLFVAIGDALPAIAANKMPLTITAVSIFVLAAFLLLFYATPGSSIHPEQPIPFSHQLHSGVKAIDCYYCHPYVDRSNHPGIPPVEKCLHCHKYIIAKHPQILKEHEYFNTNTPTPWRKVYLAAEHVLFNHKRHVKRDFACETCHGQVKQMDRLQSHRFYMGFCIECHRKEKGPLGCWLSCHS